jgi:outer membrane protein assembly factor BamB
MLKARDAGATTHSHSLILSPGEVELDGRYTESSSSVTGFVRPVRSSESRKAIMFANLAPRSRVRSVAPWGMCLIGWLFPQPAGAGDWPALHGPTADRIAATNERLAESWPVAGPPIVWTREIGTGYSACAVVGNRVVTQVQSLYEQSLICFDATSGQPLWSRRTGFPYDGGGLYPGPRATPAIHGDRVYWHSPEGQIGCVRLSDGGALWTVDLAREYGLRGVDFGCSASPVVLSVGDQDFVLVPAGGAGATLVALDTNTGSLAWKGGDDPASYATPHVVRFRDRTLVIVPGENSLILFDAATGRVWCDIELSHGYDEHSCAPLYREPHLFLAVPFRGGARRWELTLDEKTGMGKAREDWINLKFSNDVASSLLVGDAVYGFDLRDAQSRLNRASRGEFRALDWSTGKELWSRRDIGHSGLIAADGKLIAFTDTGELLLIRASPAAGDVLARVRVCEGETCWSAPALADGRVYLRTPSRLVCLDLRPPASPPATPPGAPVAGRPLVPSRPPLFDPVVLVGGDREYPATTPEWDELRDWWGWSLGGLMVSCVVAGVVVRRQSPMGWTLALAGAWSVVGTPLLNRREGTYVFLWPLALWCGLHAAMIASRRARGAGFRDARRWGSYLTGTAYLGLCVLYFHLCRRLGLAPEWSFLAGFLAAITFSLVAIAAERVSTPPWRMVVLRAFLLGLSFSAYYWSSVLFMKWRLVAGS